MGKMGWIVALVVIVAAGAYYFWPKTTEAPTGTNGTTTTQQQSSGTQLTENDVAGTWRSNTDPKFTREIRTDGAIIDRYEGEPTAGLNGEWSVVENASAEPALSDMLSFVTGKTVIKVVWEGGIETTFFLVNDVSATEMTTTDLTGTGSVTTYTRI